MTALDPKTLPKRIKQTDLCGLAGEHMHWYCTTCRKWRTSKIKPGGSVTCSVCGGEPDWKKRPPTLAYRSRLKRVEALCAEDSEWRAWYDDAERRYGEYIDNVAAGLLPRQAKESGWRHFQEVWREVDRLADYILSAKDSPATHAPHAYSEAGLQRRYQDSRRGHNTVSLSDLGLRYEDCEENARLTNEELAEILSVRASHGERLENLYDKYFEDDFLNQIRDPLERDIARDFSKGFGKRDVERKYGLSERQVRTKVTHIAKALRNM